MVFELMDANLYELIKGMLSVTNAAYYSVYMLCMCVYGVYIKTMVMNAVLIYG